MKSILSLQVGDKVAVHFFRRLPQHRTEARTVAKASSTIITLDDGSRWWWADGRPYPKKDRAKGSSWITGSPHIEAVEDTA